MKLGKTIINNIGYSHRGIFINPVNRHEWC